MTQFEAQKVIEALRSGIPSRTVGQYFSGTRTKIVSSITAQLESTCEGNSSGMILTGKYGEGKTHMLNTVFNLAHSRNMVVSMIPLSKESPYDKLHFIYKKLMANTYLPNRQQPGFMQQFEERLQDSIFASDLILYASADLKCNKLSYLMKAFIKEKDEEVKHKLRSDLLGDFVANADLKKIYKAQCHETLKFNENFAKTKHIMDYFSFMSYVFTKLGYAGWVILIDEAELIGRAGKKPRLNAYANMASFLNPSRSLHSVFTLYAFTASYADDVIDSKHDFENLEEVYPDDPMGIKGVLNAIIKAPQLQPLTKDEIHSVFETMIDLHAEAYQWKPEITADQLQKMTDSSGFLLRTKLRSAIETLDQLYQYGEAGNIRTGTLTSESYEEDIPDISEA